MIGRLQHGLRARQRRIRVDEVRWRIDRSANFACVAVLVFRAADGAGAPDVAVRQEHRFDRIVELIDRLRVDESCAFEPAVNILRQLDVFGRIGRMPVIEA